MSCASAICENRARTFALATRRSTIEPRSLVRVAGYDPTRAGWKPAVQPLHLTRAELATGVEPASSNLPSCAPSNGNQHWWRCSVTLRATEPPNLRIGVRFLAGVPTSSFPAVFSSRRWMQKAAVLPCKQDDDLRSDVWAPRIGIEPISLARQASRDTSRVTRLRVPSARVERASLLLRRQRARSAGESTG